MKALPGCVVALVALMALRVDAQCDPAGRGTFVAGLEALNRGDLRAAEAQFETLVQAQPNCAEARNNLAVVLFEQGRHEEADEQLRRAVELNPDYQRARYNLRRVERVVRGEDVAPEIEPGLPGGPLRVVTGTPPRAVAATGGHASPGMRTPVRGPRPKAPAALPAAPANLAAVEPQGATACVLDPAMRQVCVYRRGAAGIVPEACYPITSMPVGLAVHWLVPSAVSDARIRLVDVSGQQRLRVVPDSGAASEASMRLKAADFARLVDRSAPWRTGWVLRADPIDAVTAAQAADAVRAALERWRSAWDGANLDAYVSAYGPSFVPQGDRSLARWRASKQYLFAHSGNISVALSAPSIYLTDGGTTVITSFEQAYRSALHASHDLKVLRWQRETGGWRITAETVLSEEAAEPPRHQRPGG